MHHKTVQYKDNRYFSLQHLNPLIIVFVLVHLQLIVFAEMYEGRNLHDNDVCFVLDQPAELDFMVLVH